VAFVLRIVRQLPSKLGDPDTLVSEVLLPIGTCQTFFKFASRPYRLALVLIQAPLKFHPEDG